MSDRITFDPEPQPSDGPDYHAEHAAWRTRNPQAVDDRRVKVALRYSTAERAVTYSSLEIDGVVMDEVGHGQ